MTKIGSKQKLIALLLSLITIFSSFANVAVVWGEGDDVVTNYFENIIVTDNSVIGKIEDGIGYIKYGYTLGLDCNNCNWEEISNIRVVNSSGEERVIHEPGVLSLPKVDGTYSILLVLKDSTSYTADLADVTSFSTVVYDEVPMSINSVTIGGKVISNNVWVVGTDYNMSIVPNIPTSNINTVKVELNNTEIPNTVEDGVISVLSENVKSVVTKDNVLKVTIVNIFGTEFSYTISFKNDSSKITVTEIKTSGSLEYTEDEVIMNKGTEVDATINGGISEVTSIEIKKDDEVIATEFPFIINDEGCYTVTIKTESGNTTTEKLFGDHTVKFDGDKPKMKEVTFCEEVTDFSKWYNENGVLEFTVTDNIALSDSALLTINDIEYPVSSTSVGGSVKEYKYSVNTNIVEQKSNGVYDIKLIVKDLSGNDLNYEKTLKVDIANPTPEGITVNSKKVINNVHYIVDNIVVNGHFTDVASGVKQVSFKKDSSDDYNNITLPYTVSENGTFKIEDNAGNVQEYTVDTLLTLIGIGSYVVDKDTPNIEKQDLVGEYVKDGVDYFSTIPTIVYEITDDNMQSVDFYVNGVKQISTYEFDNIYEFTPSGITDGKITVKVIATDVVDRTDEDEFSFVIDTNAPINLSVNAPKPINQKGGKVYFNSNVNIKVSAEDKTSGIKGYYLNEYSDIEGNFTISEDGSYSVKAVDNLSNETSLIPLKELLGWGSNDVIVDINNPDINTERPEGESSVKANWYDKNVTYAIKITDDKGINKAYVTINGITVDTFSTDEINVKSVNLSADTSKVKANDDGSYNIKVFVEDNSKRTDNWEDTIYIDTKAPDNLKVSVPEPSNKKGGNIYYNSAFDVVVSAEDDYSGVQTYYLNEEENNQGKFTITSDGGYSVSAVDILGNDSGYKTLASLLSWSGNNIVIDSDKPNITADRPEGESSKKANWYGKDVVYEITITDNKGIDKAYVTINGTKVDEFSTDSVDDKDVTLSADTSKVTPNSDGSYNIEVFVEDNSKNPNSWSDTIYIDGKAPVNLSVSAPKPVNEKGGFVYYNSNFGIQVSAEDTYSGVDIYTLNDKTNTTGEFTISADGEYLVSAKDVIGNNTGNKELSSLLGWGSNSVVIDSDPPVITTSRPSGESSNKANWFGNDVTYNISISDNKGIDNAYVTINGVKVDTYSTDSTNSKGISLQADTSKVEPNDDGSYVINVYAEDNGKLTDDWSDKIYIDKTNPNVVDFVISGDVNRNGATISGSSNKYGFFFDGSGSIQISTTDKGKSSGIHSIWYRFDGQDWKQVKTNGDTIAYVDVPDNYKGTIQAYVQDNVGHKSSTEMPDGLVSESSNTHINYSKVNISFATTNHYDENNLPLYNSSTKGTVNVACNWSGLKKLVWGIGGDTLGTISDFSNASSWDKNLALSFDTDMILDGNANALTFWVKVVDNTGHISENSRQFSIDKDKPTISVSYDKSNQSGFYNSNRVATITVNELNFDSSKFTVSGKAGTLSGWSKVDGAWKSTMTFNNDGDYDFTLSCEDRAGNKSNTYESESFTVDKTAPKILVSWDNNNSKNGNYYKSGRVAVITVNEHNFDSSLINVSGADISGWSHNGDIHTATAKFSNDGEYSLSVDGSDKATNKASEGYKSDEFIIDTTKPDIDVSGISKGVSYKNDVSFFVTLTDAYFDESVTSVSFYGKNHNKVTVNGRFNGSTAVFSYDNFAKEEGIDDIYTLVVSVSDMAGNYSEEKISFSVNRFGSKYSFYDASYIGNYLNGAKDIKIIETNVDKIDISKVKVSITLNGKEIEVLDSNVKITEEEVNGKYLYTYFIDKGQFAKDGKYTVQIFSVSDDGTEYTSVAEEYDFIIDTSKPEIIISGITGDTKYQEYSRVVTIDVRDLSGVKEINVYVNNEKVDVEYIEGVYIFTIYEDSDYQSLKVEVVDNAGNSNTAKVENFMITSNIWLYLLNQVWFKVILGIISLGIIFLILVLVWRKKSNDKEEEKLVKENEAYYHSSGNSSSKSVTDEAGTDVVSEVDVKENTNFVEKPDDDSKTDIIE